MRITNTMMTNSMLLRINNNMNQLDEYYTQMSSGKKIQKPSEDPILASRALRLRNTVSYTEQYSSNADQAISWMNTTESAFSNITSIMTSMSELCVQGASDQYKIDDRKQIVNQFNSYVEQIESELNSTYMGRYVFSGYKTNTPPIAVDDATGKNILDEDVYSVKLDAEKLLETVQTTIVDKANDLASQIADINSKIADIVGPDKDLDALTQDQLDTVSAYETSRHSVVSELTELISGNDSAIIETTADHNILYGNMSDLNGAAVFVDSTTANEMTVEINEAKTNFNFYINGQLVDISIEVDPEYLLSEDIQLEVGINNYITINSTAPSVYTEEMYNELHYFEKVYDYMNGTISKEDLNIYFNGKPYADLSESEITSFDESLRTSFEEMISKVNNYNASVTEQQTNLGVRINRINLIKDRLGDDTVNYTKLLSENEDINYADAAMNFNVANASYQASLKVGMTITQLTLADYL